MAKSLDAEITAFLNELEALREKNPVDDVGKALEDMFDAQSAVEGKALNEQGAAFQKALDALAAATKAVKLAKDDPSKTADGVNLSNAAVKAVMAALAS
ncbi:MAG: hypothetical protein C4516_10070 [Oxalobacter sp.]|jgi:ABC-type phosphate transport system auxiliary subunit|nr:MAG: hypothetical protein C4516_10070 [Oxalobacter sp.]